MTTTLNAADLDAWISGQRRFVLIDVVPEEFFNAQRLPAAKRACVHEVDFLDQVKALGATPDEPLVVYGAGDGSLDSAVAAEKLERAGYRNVFDFRGGRTAWHQAGGAFEGDGTPPACPGSPRDGTCVIDPEKCAIEWVGWSPSSTHRGTLQIRQGELTISGGKLAGGRIVLDMRSIRNSDLADPAMRSLLESHLMSDDFFDVERFPESELKLLSAKEFTGTTPGTPNYEVTADLTLKDVTRPVTFPAIVCTALDGALTAVAQLEIDRTRWNVLYGSGRIFRMLGKHLVNDTVTLFVKITAGVR